MTYREAIEIIEDCRYCKKKVGGECVGDIECWEAKGIAIKALYEREERSKVCTCWENAQKEIKIANGETFCSMCGKPLKEV